jgi:hypothetical protein
VNAFDVFEDCFYTPEATSREHGRLFAFGVSQRGIQDWIRDCGYRSFGKITTDVHHNNESQSEYEHERCSHDF